MTAASDLPDRELDALVSERVFGKTVVAHDWPCGYDPECGDYEASMYQVGGDGGLYAPSSWHEDFGPVVAATPGGWPPRVLDPHAEVLVADVDPVPFYSTDVRAAWRVVDKMIVRGYVWFAVQRDPQEKAGLWTAMFKAEPGDGYSIYVSAETDTRAICLAALAALEQER